MRNVKLIIFDMDGLLVDSEGFYSEGWKFAIKQAGLAVDDEVVDSWVGQGKQQTIDLLMDLTHDETVVNSIVEAREEFIYDMLYKGKMNEMPFAKDVMKRLKDRGYTIGIASSTHRKRAEDILAHLGLDKYVSYSKFGDDVDMVKPDPAVYLEVLKESGYKVNEAIAVEDSFTGSMAANNAGLRTVVIPYVEFETEKIRNIENVIRIDKTLKVLLELFEL